jgi:hypothetical protein
VNVRGGGGGVRSRVVHLDRSTCYTLGHSWRETVLSGQLRTS